VLCKEVKKNFESGNDIELIRATAGRPIFGNLFYFIGLGAASGICNVVTQMRLSVQIDAGIVKKRKRISQLYNAFIELNYTAGM
jgi:hypothetical protein